MTAKGLRVEPEITFLLLSKISALALTAPEEERLKMMSEFNIETGN